MTSKQGRPNILYLMFDQAKASAMTFMGNRYLNMPFCNRMAEQGWVFEEAYAASSICTPSRASVHTGMFPLVHQVTCHQNRVPPNLPQLAELLMAGGYYTAVAGHYEPERNLSRGWHEQTPMHERGPLYHSWQEHIKSGRKDVAWSSGSIDIDAKDGNSARLTDRALRMVDQAEASGMPFFLHICYDDPHPPYFVPRPYDTLIDPESLPLPELGDSACLPEWHKKMREECGTYQASDADIRNVLATYYGMIRCVDDEMARVHAALNSRGLLETTWIIIGSDHGDYTGEKGFFNKSESLYECLLHVPLIIMPPQGSPLRHSRRITDLVSTVDLFPTILKLAGLEPPANQGRDLVEWISADMDGPLRTEIYAQVGGYQGFIGTSFPSGMPASGRHPNIIQTVRNHESSYVSDPDNGDEAYDLTNDPKELVNLLNPGRPALSARTSALAERISSFEAECMGLRDSLGVIPGDRGFVRGWE